MTPVTDDITKYCLRHGLDLSATMSVGAYNAVVAAEYRLNGDDDALVLLIGNTRALWPHIERFALHTNHDHQVDTYVQNVVRAVTNARSDLIDVRYSHEPPPRRIAIQRLAQLAGLAWLSPSHLSVHPVFGP